MNVTENPHPAFAGRPHQLTAETGDLAGRRQIVATCSCLGWSASLLVRAGRAEHTALAEVTEAHGEHAAGATTPALLVPTAWTPRSDTP